MNKKLFGITLLLVVFITPITYTYAKITPDCGQITTTPQMQSDGKTPDTSKPADKQIVPCDFNSLLTLVNNVINFLLVDLATPLAALAICYAGFLLLSGGSNEHKRSQAKTIIKNVVIGYIIALAAWLIINTILSKLGFTGPDFLNTKK